eukprot:269983-Pleurochrysis_carterae.AAC.1
MSEFDDEPAADKADLTAHRERTADGRSWRARPASRNSPMATSPPSKQVDAELLKLKSKSAKVPARKEQIRIRVLGLGRGDLATAWSKAGKELTIAELHAYLNTNIAQQRTSAIPSKPPVPAR